MIIESAPVIDVKRMRVIAILVHYHRARLSSVEEITDGSWVAPENYMTLAPFLAVVKD